MTEETGLDWRGAAIALGMTAAVVLFALATVSGLQDPDRPPPEEAKALLHSRTRELVGADACGPADLKIVSAMHGRDGEGQEFRPDEDLTIWLAAANPCPAAVSFTTPTLCLFSGFTLSGGAGPDRQGGTMCAQAVTSWSIPAGGAERVSYQIGNLPPGAYRVRAPFAGAGLQAELAFKVVP